VVRSKVVDVPSEMILSIGDSGREVIVAGLSPVNGIITQSVVNTIARVVPLEKLYFETKYE
jgi:hypothetical protein